jgi:hypothetical protein
MSADDARIRRDRAKAPRDRGAPPAEKAEETPRPDQTPAAGPHAAPRLSNPDATPGAGALQATGEEDDMGSTG